jgi:general secretion pathway protein G
VAEILLIPIKNTVRVNRGFTLIELAITVAIVGILASAAYPFAELSLQRQKESDLRSALREIRTAIDTYRDATRSGQVAKSIDETGYPRKLEDLVSGVDDFKDPKHAKIYFLRRLPRDPFYPDSSAPAGETWGKRSYASPPDMPMEGSDVFDVYSRSPSIGMSGIPYRDW